MQWPTLPRLKGTPAAATEQNARASKGCSRFTAHFQPSCVAMEAVGQAVSPRAPGGRQGSNECLASAYMPAGTSPAHGM